MPQVLIVADDLSGAADCGIACAAAGLSTHVVLGGEATDADVVAIDADTRRCAPAEAGRETRRLLGDRNTPALLFKKLDSTLRGNWPEEIAALRAFRPEASIVLAPAFPATGRTTVGGRQFVAGVPLEETELGRRERMTHARIDTLLRRADLDAVLIGLDLIRDEQALTRHFAEQAGAVLLCDAETEADLARIARAAASLGHDTIWAGSAGLARHLPAACGLEGRSSSVRLPAIRGPILFVVGSLSRVSADQVARLREASGIRLLTVAPDVLRLSADSAPARAQADAIATLLATGDDVVVQLGAEDSVDPHEGLALCTALAKLVAPLADRIGGLVSTGGETARAVLTAFGEQGLRLIGEVEPGVPLAVTMGVPALPVITKAGAFGRPDTLIRCRDVLRDPARAAALHVTLIPEPQERGS